MNLRPIEDIQFIEPCKPLFGGKGNYVEVRTEGLAVSGVYHPDQVNGRAAGEMPSTGRLTRRDATVARELGSSRVVNVGRSTVYRRGDGVVIRNSDVPTDSGGLPPYVDDSLRWYDKVRVYLLKAWSHTWL